MFTVHGASRRKQIKKLLRRDETIVRIDVVAGYLSVGCRKRHGVRFSRSTKSRLGLPRTTLTLAVMHRKFHRSGLPLTVNHSARVRGRVWVICACRANDGGSF